MAIEKIKLLLGGKSYIGWTNVTILRSVESMASIFQLNLLDVWDKEQALDFSPHVSCKIIAGEDTLITGYLDRQRLLVNPDSNLISVSGRCKTADLVDCSVNNKPPTWKKNLPILKIVSDLAAPYNIKVISNSNLGKYDKEFSITTGESPFDAISRLCQDSAIIPLGNVYGELLLTTISRDPSNDPLVYGDNVIEAEGINDFSKRFSHIIVKGQTSTDGGSWGTKGATGVFGESFDENIVRNRTKVITADNQISNLGAQKRASWETQVRAGRSSTVRVELNKWRQTNGELWKENKMAFVHIPHLRVSGEMLIKDVEYKLSGEEQSLTMNLVEPSIYAPEPPKKIKKKSKSQKAVWLG